MDIPSRCFRPPETNGSRWEEPKKLLDPTEKHRNNDRISDAVFRSYIGGSLPMTSWPFPERNSLETGHKSSKHVYSLSGKDRNTPVNGRNFSGKIQRLSGWNTAAIFRMLSWCSPAGTGRHFLTWDDITVLVDGMLTLDTDMYKHLSEFSSSILFDYVFLYLHQILLL